jgi:DNA-binding CsgD family transcriptional regulator
VVRCEANLVSSDFLPSMLANLVVRSVLSGSPVRTMSFPSSSNGRSLMVLVAPVKGAELDRSDFRHLRSPAAILFVCDPGSRAQIPVSWLMDAYGLTLREARVAGTVASGASIVDCARRLRISPNTVKTHLRRVYEKTGTSRQADLTRLIATIGLAQSENFSDCRHIIKLRGRTP